jgi:hypothetical protein
MPPRGGEHLEAEITTEVFQFVNGGPDGGSANEPHKVGWDHLGVYLPLLTQGAAITWLQRFMRNLDLLCAGVVLGAIAAVAFTFLGPLFSLVLLGRSSVLLLILICPIPTSCRPPRQIQLGPRAIVQ